MTCLLLRFDFVGSLSLISLQANTARDSVKIEFTSVGQPSPYELAFGVKIGPNSHSKMVSKPILDPSKGHPPYYPHTKP